MTITACKGIFVSYSTYNREFQRISVQLLDHFLFDNLDLKMFDQELIDLDVFVQSKVDLC